LERDTEQSNQSSCVDDSQLLTIDELAQMLKVPKSWVYERTRRRGATQIPHIKLGKYVRFEEHAVREYLRLHSTGYCGTR
jgi:excisionase family DNA binding protein